MTTAAVRPPVNSGGRPLSGGSSRTLSANSLRKLGRFVRVRQAVLVEGDIVFHENSAFCIVHKDTMIRRGSLMTLRELGSNIVRRVRFDPRGFISLLRLPDVIEGQFGEWKIHPGDVVAYSAVRPEETVLAIRHRFGWYRTAAPWLPLTDAEVLLDLRERRAFMTRSSARPGGLDPRRVFLPGSAVATRDTTVAEPSVWVRTGEDYWVSNSRGAAISDQMVRYELRRGTYQFLNLPERVAE